MTTPLPRDAWRVTPMRIAAIQPEIDGVATYDLVCDPPQPAAGAALPGQFHMLYLPGIGEAAISLSGDCTQTGVWRHTVRVAGRVTQSLAQLGIGAQLGVRGPFGRGWPVADWVGRDVVFVAGGIGLAPVRSALYEVLRRRAEFGRLTLIYGAREPGGLLYHGEYADWQARGLEVQTTVDRSAPGWTGRVGVVTLLLDRLAIPRPAETVVAVCGPEVMIKYTALSAAQRGITADRVWVALERNMQCAVGLCGHCQLGPEFICKDGPVLRYDRVRPLLSVEGL